RARAELHEAGRIREIPQVVVVDVLHLHPQRGRLLVDREAVTAAERIEPLRILLQLVVEARRRGAELEEGRVDRERLGECVVEVDRGLEMRLAERVAADAERG